MAVEVLLHVDVASRVSPPSSSYSQEAAPHKAAPPPRTPFNAVPRGLAFFFVSVHVLTFLSYSKQMCSSTRPWWPSRCCWIWRRRKSRRGRTRCGRCPTPSSSTCKRWVQQLWDEGKCSSVEPAEGGACCAFVSLCHSWPGSSVMIQGRRCKPLRISAPARWPLHAYHCRCC